MPKELTVTLRATEIPQVKQFLADISAAIARLRATTSERVRHMDDLKAEAFKSNSR